MFLRLMKAYPLCKYSLKFNLDFIHVLKWSCSVNKLVTLSLE
uniref:Uncharacterized protein n=1 Tax=Rhizophora mucronata TaxID=61149 RepID=A0A2P2N0N0_RHIMU